MEWHYAGGTAWHEACETVSMQTPRTTDDYFPPEPTVFESSRPTGQAPTVIVAGSRVTREFVRLLVAGAFFVMETCVQIADLWVKNPFHRKRRV